MIRANPRVLSTALFSALGLLPVACGGASRGGDGEGGSAGAPAGSGGAAPTAGKSSGAGTSHGGGHSAGTSSVAGSGSGDGGSEFPCDAPMPAGAGYEQCGNGTVHRPVISECESKLPRITLKIAPPPDGQCVLDADCSDRPHGYCASGGQLPGTMCVYGCVKDSECGASEICVCGEPVGHCVPSTCKSDAECGAGYACRSYDRSHGCGLVSFACQSSADTCGGDGDCDGGYCDGASGKFACAEGGCVVGRPFLVEGVERLAELTPRADWCGKLELGVLTIEPALRLAAANGWARIGQMEHASIAAFARFALQLLQLGAPPELVAEATRAMADETRHAELAFGIASALGGRAVGPAALNIERCLLETSLVEVVRLVLREGCIGETAAALEAREAALRAQSPELAQWLHGIADDEARHAELAFRFLGWALEQAPEPVRLVIERELLHGAPVGSAHLDSAEELALEPYGIVPPRLRAELGVTAFRQITLPCVEALLTRGAGKSAENQVLSG